MISTVCFKCNELIRDKVIIIINGNPWHEDCLRCAQCNCILNHTCYELNNVFLCLEDYFNEKLKKCHRCGVPIFPNEMVHHSFPYVFHQNCFTCNICNKLLVPNDKYFFRSSGSLLICQNDFENKKIHVKKKFFENIDNKQMLDISLNGSDNRETMDIYHRNDEVQISETPSLCLDDDLNSEMEHSFEDIMSSDNDKSSGIRRRTPRTTIKAIQLDSLKSAFAITPKPSRQIREQLAKDTGLSMRVIQVWFQNRRSKERRSKLNIQRRTEKYKFFSDVDGNLQEHLNMSTNVRQDADIHESNLQMHLNSGGFNSRNLTKMANEAMHESRYSSSWFVNRSLGLISKTV